jgi:hypothetical protein
MPEPDVTDFAAGVPLPPLRDLRSACLSDAVISSELFECDSPAFFILSIRAVSDIFRVLAKSFTVRVKI